MGDPLLVRLLYLDVCTHSLIVEDTFKAKVQESGKQCSDFKTAVFFAPKGKDTLSPKRSSSSSISRPPRLVSDLMINIYFQEWAPLFPVMDRPTVLASYSAYVANPQGVKDRHAIAQLNLIFGIAALSAEVGTALPSAFASYD